MVTPTNNNRLNYLRFADSNSSRPALNSALYLINAEFSALKKSVLNLRLFWHSTRYVIEIIGLNYQHFL
jgi:hypothetical protein